ncbi:hypothetical protein BAOM_4774 [Peribacillus asahii]|uniref:Uncharacterized protein n=1 Tax=Peribacillus asahii TaxID=228899 RepID=A0A3T0KYF5_9BACI|nr:hypothetical protein BAOM_4774 [Peribacillus asahii]
MSFIRVMKDKIEKTSQRNVPHQGYEGQNQELELVKCPSLEL